MSWTYYVHWRHDGALAPALWRVDSEHTPQSYKGRGRWKYDHYIMLKLMKGEIGYDVASDGEIEEAKRLVDRRTKRRWFIFW